MIHIIYRTQNRNLDPRVVQRQLLCPVRSGSIQTYTRLQAGPFRPEGTHSQGRCHTPRSTRAHKRGRPPARPQSSRLPAHLHHAARMHTPVSSLPAPAPGGLSSPARCSRLPAAPELRADLKAGRAGAGGRADVRAELGQGLQGHSRDSRATTPASRHPPPCQMGLPFPLPSKLPYHPTPGPVSPLHFSLLSLPSSRPSISGSLHPFRSPHSPPVSLHLFPLPPPFLSLLPSPPRLPLIPINTQLPSPQILGISPHVDPAGWPLADEMLVRAGGCDCEVPWSAVWRLEE